jgi:hypothetical protein
VALIAGGGLHGGAADIVRQRRQAVLDDRVGLGVDRALLLFELLRVTAPAILRRDDGCDDLTLMLDGVHIGTLGPMAIHAVHARSGMGAVAPLLSETARCLGVTTDTGIACLVSPVARSSFTFSAAAGKANIKIERKSAHRNEAERTTGGIATTS